MGRVFGLTGGIACGKSAVSKFFAEAGVPIVDADLIAREVVEPGTPGLQRLVAEFGDVLLPDGTLDRAKLGSMVFLDQTKLARLNNIMVPLITMRSADQMREHLFAGTPLVCYDAPTLCEAGMQDRFRPLVVVTLPLNLQVERLMRRDGFSKEEAEARINSQMPMVFKESQANFLIMNEGSLDELKVQALEVLEAVAEYEA